MSTTLTLPRYSFASSVERALVKAPSVAGHGVSFSGPSPFEIPVAITVTLAASPTRLTYEFVYSDREESEEAERPACKDRAITVRLGKKTKKILAVNFFTRVEELLHTKFANMRIVVQFDEALTNQMANTYRQSAATIIAVIKNTPDEIVQHLETALKTPPFMSAQFG